MKNRQLILIFVIYLLLFNNTFYLFQNSIYGLQTIPHLTDRKLCLIILDGLRFDAAVKMPFLSNMYNSGKAVIYKGLCEVPSTSRPGYERILTGTSTKINNIDNNNKHIPSLIPNLFRISKNNKLKTGFCGYFWVEELYPLDIDYSFFYIIRDGTTFEKSIEIIEKYQPDFMVIHPMSIDNIGHKYGGISKEYEEEVKKIDAKIKNLWYLIQKMNYTLMLVSDHGHKDEGGHGDDNPDCLKIPICIISNEINSISPIINTGTISQLDIAPTICDILGIPKTIYMTGNSLVKHDNQIYLIRKSFSGGIDFNFQDFFNITSRLTYLIIASQTIVYFTCMFIAIRLFIIN